MDNTDPKDKAKDNVIGCFIILFFVFFMMLVIIGGARWSAKRDLRRQHLRGDRYSPGAHLVFYVDPALSAASRGLHASLIASLPVFAFSSKTHQDTVECAVCLSEFVNGETGRVLPKCSHRFHIECIDMWFRSHSTCPICRAPVEFTPARKTQPEVAVIVSAPEPGSSSGLCQQGGEEVNRIGPAVSSSSSSSSIEKSSTSFVDVIVSSESFEDESVYDSPSTQSSFHSTISRMLSLETELDAERGGQEETR